MSEEPPRGAAPIEAWTDTAASIVSKARSALSEGRLPQMQTVESLIGSIEQAHQLFYTERVMSAQSTKLWLAEHERPFPGGVTIPPPDFPHQP